MAEMINIAPQWIVDDLLDTIEFYRDNLGFEVDWMGTLFAILRNGEVIIMVRQLKHDGLKRPNKIPFIKAGWHSKGAHAWDIYIWVKNVDLLYESIIQKDVNIIREIENSEYGNRDFEIEDNNGYILCFGHSI